MMWVFFGCVFFFISEKSVKAAAAEAKGGTGEGATARKGAGKREAAYSQTC